MSRIIGIASLVSKTMTRPRGAEAFQRLLPLLDANGTIELLLSSDNIISSSFLDEIVLRTAQKHSLDEIIFVIDSPEVLRKLERVFSMRDLSGKYRWSTESSIRNLQTVLDTLEEPAEEVKDII